MTDSQWTAPNIDQEREAAVARGDRDALVRLLVGIRDERADLAIAAADVQRDLLTLAGERSWVVENLGLVEIKKQTKRTGWRHAELLPVLIARIMDERETLYDPETGELLPYVQIGHNLTARLRECVSFGAGKVTGLRALGLQSDEFCTQEDDGWGVRLPARDA